MKLRNCKLSKYNGRAPAPVQVRVFPSSYLLFCYYPLGNLGIVLLLSDETSRKERSSSSLDLFKRETGGLVDAMLEKIRVFWGFVRWTEKWTAGG